jgi:hypothetical protein
MSLADPQVISIELKNPGSLAKGVQKQSEKWSLSQSNQ